MPVKTHPLYCAKEADVLAVRFDSELWGFVRIMRGATLGIWDVCSGSPDRPHAVSSSLKPEKWFFAFLSPKADETEMVSLGSMPFESDDDAWAPPCYIPPDVIDNRYRIYYRGMFRDAQKDDVEGLVLCERLTPALLVQKLQELWRAGRLRMGTDT